MEKEVPKISRMNRQRERLSETENVRVRKISTSADDKRHKEWVSA